jgi:hypothetical protein
MKPAISLLLPVALISSAVSVAQSDMRPKLPPNMFLVKPAHAAGIGELPIHNGRFFSYALPPDWTVGEDGQFALTLIAPNSHAFTVMAGNSGMAPNYDPARFVYEKLQAIHPQGLHLGQPVQAAPVAGSTYAYQFEIFYMNNGNQVHGLAKCSIAPSYDSAVMVITAAAARASEWPQYSSWLPLVADQISATNGAAFGRRGIMAQNLRNSEAFGEAARRYREWSQKNWAAVSAARDKSTAANNQDLRENLGPTHHYTNPYDTRYPIDLPNTYQYYWVDRDGNYAGTNDPSSNPNVGSTSDWRLMRRQTN